MKVLASCMALGGLAVLLTGCGQRDREPAPPAVVDGLQPGMWEATTQISSMDLAQSENEELTEEMQAAEFTKQVCLASSDSRKPPIALILGSDDACGVLKSNLDKGQLSGSVVCENNFVTAESPFFGQYDKTSMSVLVTVTEQKADGSSSEHSIETTSKRIGDCKGVLGFSESSL